MPSPLTSASRRSRAVAAMLPASSWSLAPDGSRHISSNGRALGSASWRRWLVIGVGAHAGDDGSDCGATPEKRLVTVGWIGEGRLAAIHLVEVDTAVQVHLASDVLNFVRIAEIGALSADEDAPGDAHAGKNTGVRRAAMGFEVDGGNGPRRGKDAGAAVGSADGF